MCFSFPEELSNIIPFSNGKWNKEYLYEYLVWYCDVEFEIYIDDFFKDYLDNADLAELLFSFLLDDDYDGSDCQIGAAHLISKMNRQLLKTKKELLLKAQENEVYWKRPFPCGEHLKWL